MIKPSNNTITQILAKDAIVKREQLCAHIMHDYNSDVETYVNNTLASFKPAQPHGEHKRTIVQSLQTMCILTFMNSVKIICYCKPCVFN